MKDDVGNREAETLNLGLWESGWEVWAILLDYLSFK